MDINATGFRKILKKWDKRSKSTTKELYLARQVEVQPVFNRQVKLIHHQTLCKDGDLTHSRSIAHRGTIGHCHTMSGGYD